MLNSFSHYSVLQSVLSPSDIVGVAKEYSLNCAALTDFNSMAGIVEFKKSADKAGIKPVLGFTTRTFCNNHVTFLAKNKIGYNNLIKILGEINSKKSFAKGCRVKSEYIQGNSEGLICLFGQDCDWDVPKQVQNVAGALRDIFAENLYIVAGEYDQNIDQLSDTFGTSTIYDSLVKRKNTADSQYLLNVLKAVKYKTTLSNLNTKEDQFFYDDRNGLYKDEIGAIFEQCENYDIFSKPSLPTFHGAGQEGSLEFLKKICRESFKEKIPREEWPRYTERIKRELDVFEKAGLADYFLILWDIIKYAESKGYLVGPGRGSAAGCLVSFLLNITKVDPVKFDLLFSRFYNEGRLGSMPDIDVDFPAFAREDVVKQIIKTYGKDKVGQIVTYQTFMGRAALKAILRVEGSVGFTEMNEITKYIPDKAKISDELQEMKEEGKDESVILWALENRKYSLDNWVELNDENELEGPMAETFKRAIQLEGIKSAQSRHPAGVIISDSPLIERGPVLYDETSGEQIVGLEYEDAELLGYVKYDCLGISSLDRIMDINV
jgi:DNA polymerase III subunit alpha